MRSCLSMDNPDYIELAEVTDKLRWDCFLEGRIAKTWIEVMKPALAELSLYLTPERLGRSFTDKLLQVTHEQ